MSAPATVIDWEATQSCLWRWVVDQTGLSDDAVLWGRQGVPQASRPFVSLDIVSGPEMIGNDSETYHYQEDQPTGQELAVMQTGARRFTLSINAFVGARDDSAGESLMFGNNAVAYVSKLQESLDLRTVREKLLDANITISSVQPVVQFLQNEGDEIISRASFDIAFFVAGSREVNRTTYVERMIGVVALQPPETEVPFDITLES